MNTYMYNAIGGAMNRHFNVLGTHKHINYEVFIVFTTKPEEKSTEI